MSRLEDIEQAVEQLSPEELARFRDWFLELQERLWDAQIERDVRSGKLEKLADRWRTDYAAGQHTDLVAPKPFRQEP